MEKRKKRRASKDGLWLRGRIYWTTIAGERVSTGCKDREAARLARARLERELADPRNAAAARTTVGDMIGHAMEAHRHAKGRLGGRVTQKTIDYHEEKLGHFARIFGVHRPLLEVDYDLVGAYIKQRESEPGSSAESFVSPSTIGKELKDLRFALKLERARGAYPHDVDHVTRTHAFAAAGAKRDRYLPWPEIAALISAVADYGPQAGELGEKAREHQIMRAQQVAWHIAVGGRFSESEHAEMKDHDLVNWRVRVRGTKSKKADARIPIAPAFRRLLEFALWGRPKTGKLFKPWLNFNRALKRACERAGIDRCSTNDLRRTHMTLLHQAGVPNEVLKNISRHTTTRMLDERYAVDDIAATARLIQGVEWPALSDDNTVSSHDSKKGPKTP